MIVNRRAIMAAVTGATVGGMVASAAAAKEGGRESLLVDLDREPDFEVELWPDGAPGGEDVRLNEHFVERENPWKLRDRAVHEVTRPRLTVFRAIEPDGSAVLLIPGGGYKWVVVEKEGWEGARYFNRKGATVYVLTYRLPHQGWAAGPDTPLQDAQRAMRVLRSRAAADKVDPDRIAVMGFSAGGHVAGSLLTRHQVKAYSARDDEAEGYSARPTIGALIYPVATMKLEHAHKGSRDSLIGLNPSAAMIEKYSIETAPPGDTPPTFFLHASDDEAVPVENTLLAYKAFKDAGAPVAMHVFEKGGHGFGLRGIDASPLRDWPALFWRWGVEHGVFTPLR